MTAGLPGDRPGALVIGGDYQGLATARSLGRRGIGVVIVDDERSIGRYSRYTRAHMRVADLRSEAATVAALLECAERHALDGWVLYPTRDETVAAIARNRPTLATRYRVATAPWEAISCAWDKRNTYRAAAEHGVGVPRTWTLRALGDVADVDGCPPFVVKPAIKERFFYATGRKAWRADTRPELERRVRDAAALIDVSEILVQELIPGSGDTQLAYCAFFKDGQARAVMTAQRLRQHPPDFGRASTYVRTIEDDRLIAPSERFLAAIGYYGLVELEYKYDARDGQLKLLDFNPRTWGYHGLAQRAGVDFPYLLYADQLGLAAATGGRAHAGLCWLRLATDVPTGVLELAAGRRAWRPYLRSLLRVDVGAVFSRDDPLPAVAELGLLPYAAIRRGL